MTSQFRVPSAPELEAVERLKVRVAEKQFAYKFTDVALLRYIRGSKGDEEKAYHYIEKHVQWRIDEDVENVNKESAPNEIATNKAVIFGRDKRDRPIVYVMVRRHKANNRDINEVKKFIIYSFNELMRLSNPVNEQMTLIFDMTSFSMGNMDYEVVRLLIDLLQFNFPEVLGQCFIVDAPFVFWACWYVIKPWIDPVTALKIIFVNSSQLSEYIDESQIIKDIGGDK